MSGPVAGKYICYEPGVKAVNVKEECYAHISDATVLARVKAIDRTCCTYT
mgnify:CR=1 FL=1